VLSARFSDFHANLVIGGTYSGQILLWDTRAKSLPVLRTPLSAIGHTHPVYSMSMVGTQNAHNLITASTDGLVCSWQLDMLVQPQVIKFIILLIDELVSRLIFHYGRKHWILFIQPILVQMK
jgi:WD40 repeat protein